MIGNYCMFVSVNADGELDKTWNVIKAAVDANMLVLLKVDVAEDETFGVGVLYNYLTGIGVLTDDGTDYYNCAFGEVLFTAESPDGVLAVAS